MNSKTKGLLSIAALCIFTGCAQKEIKPKGPQYNENQTIQNIKVLQSITKNELSKRDALFERDKMTSAGNYGPSLILNKDNYEIRKFTNEPLLFANNGVKDRIKLFLLDVKTEKGLDHKASSFGFKDTKQMFEYFYLAFNKSKPEAVNESLKYMSSEGLINLNNLTTPSLNKMTKDIKRSLYGAYFHYEKNETIKKEWRFDTDMKKTYLEEDDYKPYALVVLVMKDLLSSDKEKILYAK